jgi:hypothetical protein
MKYPMYNENELRKDIINKFIAVPVLGENYVDWHTEDGKCGLTLFFGEDRFDIVIEKKR